MEDGGRFDPASGVWSPISGVGAPSARGGHSAVWTGSEMVVWGGFDGNLDLRTGGRYDPATDTWKPTRTAASVTGWVKVILKCWKAPAAAVTVYCCSWYLVHGSPSCSTTTLKFFGVASAFTSNSRV